MGKKKKSAKVFPTALSHMYQIYVREGGRCFWCQKFLRLHLRLAPNKAREQLAALPDTWPLATKDHLLPQSRGGRGGLHNLVLSCEHCNHQRGNKLLNPVTWMPINVSVLSIFLREVENVVLGNDCGDQQQSGQRSNA